MPMWILIVVGIVLIAAAAVISHFLTVSNLIAVSCFTSSSTVFNKYSFACSEVSPEIRSSEDCTGEIDC